MAQNISLAVWTEQENKRLKCFVEWFEKHQKEDPEHFPANMSEGEWDEQYMVFDEIWCLEQQADENWKQVARIAERKGHR